MLTDRQIQDPLTDTRQETL